jgi:hypothetical protein
MVSAIADLTHADFCLWGHLTGTACWKIVNTRGELRRLIKAMSGTIRHLPGIFKLTWNSWCLGTPLQIQQTGGHHARFGFPQRCCFTLCQVVKLRTFRRSMLAPYSGTISLRRVTRPSETSVNINHATQGDIA